MKPLRPLLAAFLIPAALFLAACGTATTTTSVGASRPPRDDPRPAGGGHQLPEGEPSPGQLRPADGRHRQARLPAVLRRRHAVHGKGFESAVAYAIAKQLGFAPSEVKWTVEPFNASYAPGPKKFDFDVNQISITPARAKRVDFSKPYYTAPQAVVALKQVRRRQRQVAGRPQVRQARRPGRHDEPRRGDRDDPAVVAAQGVQRLQRHGPRAEDRRRRRGRRRPPDGVLPHGRAGAEQQDRRPVRRARRRHLGRGGSRREPAATTTCSTPTRWQRRSGPTTPSGWSAPCSRSARGCWARTSSRGQRRRPAAGATTGSSAPRQRAKSRRERLSIALLAQELLKISRDGVRGR